MSVVSTTTQIYNNEGLSSCSSSSMVLSFTLVVTNDHPSAFDNRPSNDFSCNVRTAVH